MQPILKTLLICMALLFGTVLFGQSTYKNPIISGMNPDPSICRVGNDFYLVTSTFEYFPGLPIYQSKDLVHWKMIGYVLSRASNCPLGGAHSSGGNYAPTIRYNNGTYYVTCTNYGGQGSQGAFYVTATNPAGPWSEPHWVNNWGVDPSLLFANDSIYYVHPDDKGNFLMTTLNPATGKFYKDPKIIAHGTGSSSPEGPHLYKINDYYYLMSAEGGTGYQHMEVIQRSESPWGPYELSPTNPVISNKSAPGNPFQAIGHADLVQLQNGSWWLICLGIRPKGGNYQHLGRETFLAPVLWNADGWPKGGTNGVMKEEYPIPILSEYIWDEETNRDNFDNITLNLPWNFVRNPYDKDWSLTEKPGYLRLKGSKINLREKDSPAFVARRQTAFNMVASTKISFIPTTNNEEAGLVVRADDMNHYDLLITRFAGRRVVMLRKYLLDKVTKVNYKEISDGDIILRVSATELQYQFWVQEEGKPALLIGTAATKDISNENIGGFIGAFIGMYASGNGTPNVNPADFDWFEYEEDPILPYSWSVGSKDALNQMFAPEIISASSVSYNKVKLVWNNISNETGYIIEKNINDKFESISYTLANDTMFTDDGLSEKTLFIYRVIARNDVGYSYPSIATSVLTLPKPGPFLGAPSQILGKIEAENYDYGEYGEAWYDSDTINRGGRCRTEGVDVEDCWDTGGGYAIGWINNGEWVEYTIDVNDTIVNVELRIASQNGGSIKFELDGEEIAKTNISATGGYQTWKTVTLPNLKLTKGRNKKLKMTFLESGFNINWINFTKVTLTSINEDKNEGIKVYPNPTGDVLNIESKNFKYTHIDIYNLQGKCLLSQSIDYQPKNLLHFYLSDGQYILSLSDKEQKKTIKFIVIR
jgi:xylan 1,4-beta-xylosidase